MTSTVVSPLRIEAEGKIDAKLAILESWMQHGIPWLTQDYDGQFVRDASEEKVLDYYPRTLEQFAEWDGTQNCLATRNLLPELRSMSRNTLNQSYHSLRRGQVDKLLESLDVKALDQLQRANKASRIQALESEVRRLENVVQRQEQDVVIFRRKADTAENKLHDERKARVRATKQYREEIRVLQAEVASLTKQVRSIIGLKRT